MKNRVQILVQGIVQGVGFRPFIYSLANKYNLKGYVLNNNLGVLVDVEGETPSIEQFVKEIQLNPPPLSVIDSIEVSNILDLANFSRFNILESSAKKDNFVLIPADIATCDNCLEEFWSSDNRRYRYPFINCTNCGPRFTIIQDLPYDRKKTTMKDFLMCEHCLAEYENPLDRRFHAEPTCCATCGPQLLLTNSERQTLLSGNDNVVTYIRTLLKGGEIVAIKSLGGFHLACDALNKTTVERLRNHKHRQEKPFALMANSIEIIEKYCVISEQEKKLLLSVERPIVLLAVKPNINIPDAIAPGLNTLGFMLPYTPLHHLLLENSDGLLVMTSGNFSDEPICFSDDEAVNRLGSIVDYFLLHNRPIHIRMDDSVVRRQADKTLILRRSRGYAPTPIKTSFKFNAQILACGAELKNTFCLTRDNYAFISHHIGDLENLETLNSFTQGIQHYKQLLNLNPEVVVYDLHPEYLSTKYALETDGRLIKIGVQHHHAHIASCLVDNSIEGQVLGIAMDGLGFGEDGKFWGGEFLVANFACAERVAHLDYVAMPGATKAINEPWRMAASYLYKTFGDDFLKLNLPLVKQISENNWTVLRSMIRNGINSPESSSMGRLFDAVSSLLNIRQNVTYEGQAAIELENIVDKSEINCYEFELTNEGIIKAETLIKSILEDLFNNISIAKISSRFHWSVVYLIAKIASKIRSERHLNQVVLSGGVFQNMILLERTCLVLRGEGFEVFTHSRMPSNDGAISLGQAAIANARLAKGV